METDNKEIIDKLREDKNYYGKFGKQFLSNSDISTLLTNPLSLGTPMENRPAFLIGSYFHTAILEPGKLKKMEYILTLLEKMPDLTGVEKPTTRSFRIAKAWKRNLEECDQYSYEHLNRAKESPDSRISGTLEAVVDSIKGQDHLPF